jgi:RNA polymerase sigma-70 factor (ECF subfamily)
VSTLTNPAFQQVATSGVTTDYTVAGLLREHGQFVWRVLRRLGVSVADVDDVCQEVFLVVHFKLPEFEGRSTVRTWLYGICVRTASDYRRGRARRQVLASNVQQSSMAEQNQKMEQPQETLLAVHQACAALDRILDELDDDKRAVFVLYEIEELTMAEAATVLECPLQTAYSRLHAARREVEAAVSRMRERGEEP